MGTFYIKHITKYTYDNPVIDGANLIRLHPINDAYQSVTSHYLIVTNNAFVETYTDFYKNIVGTFMLTEPIKELYIESNIEVNTTPRPYPIDTLDPATQWEALKSLKYDGDFVDFLSHKSFTGTPDFLKVIEDLNITEKTPFQVTTELCAFVYNTIKYTKGVTKVDTSIDEAWALKAGVCQDITTIMLKIVRMCGIPARYVSGYICTNDNNTRGEGATHAWLEAYIPSYGWFGFDPTNNTFANENHVRLAVGRDYSDCAPVKGVFKGKVDADLYVLVEVSTTKQTDVVKLPETPVSSIKNNSFKHNLERIQQQQQQQ
ncbi:transglutaminase family protein [Siansivirga zeaxanthinifaciens]|uniref:Transglutaminase n=1 Tax=Siansivirga zeaxanthinifaciens CC-SAMT-1 TaxID=1454006 RepID=A0A0C5VW42_9FLAO|nr:transglutaminase family protein [Siansivirga zeaxanthinifaciens]AJR03316.1 transglutaminase [Siansivirga zeaxanthinifaciens CC-SAMT-1]